MPMYGWTGPKAKRQDAPAHLQQWQQAPNVVVIEMGADRDHAQDQDRTRRFFVGLEIPHGRVDRIPARPPAASGEARAPIGQWEGRAAMRIRVRPASSPAGAFSDANNACGTTYVIGLPSRGRGSTEETTP